jgi:hypothetical protein
MSNRIDLDSALTERLVVAGLLAFFVGLGMLSVRHKSPTADEFLHLRYGMRILDGSSRRLNATSGNPDDSKMAFSVLNAIPQKVGAYLPDGWLKRFSQTIQAGRPITILFSTLIAFFLYRWARDLYGKGAALFTLLLYCLEPSIIAHSQLVTTDIYGMGMIMLTTYSLWRYNRNRSLLNLLVVSVLLGVSLLAKYTALFLIPLFVCIQFAHDAPAIVAWLHVRDRRSLIAYLGNWLGAILVIALVGLLIVNAGYLFNGTFTPLGDYAFRSSVFQSIQARLGTFRVLPSPVPSPYVQGLDLVNYRDEVGLGFGRIFLLGRLSDSGFLGYYFVNMALKTPLAILAAIAAGIVLLLKCRPKIGDLLRNESFLLIPVAWFLCYMNYLLHAQLGIRLILVIFPFLLILAGNLTRDINIHSPWRLGFATLLSVWLAVSVFSYYPNFLAYFNEIVWDRRTTYRYLADSNLNWGQSDEYLRSWLEDHVDAVLDPPTPTAGLIIVDPNKLDGVPKIQQADEFAWLRDNFDPVDIVANTYPVFRVTPADLASLGYTTRP